MNTLFNPIVTSFEVDGFDHADSQPVMINMDIQYENFSINPVVNGFIAEEDMKSSVKYGYKDTYKKLKKQYLLADNDICTCGTGHMIVLIRRLS